jgi:hypothetical protein
MPLTGGCGSAWSWVVIDGGGSDQDGSFGSFQSPGFGISFGKGQRRTPGAAAKHRNPAMGLVP